MVYQLFALAAPDQAYFGQKDYQQVKIIERMTKDLRLKINIKSVAIARDPDGLAMSSRNLYLNAEQRQKALELPRTINALAESLHKNGLKAVQTRIQEIIKEPMWDYLEVLNGETLLPPQDDDKFLVLAGAIFMAKTRLLDNRTVELNVR